MKLSKKQLELAMARKGLTQKDLAKIAHISRSTIIRALNEEEIAPRTAGNIAIGLGIDIEKLLTH